MHCKRCVAALLGPTAAGPRVCHQLSACSHLLYTDRSSTRRKGGAISEAPHEVSGMMASDSRPSTVAGGAGQGSLSRAASEDVVDEDIADQ